MRICFIGDSSSVHLKRLVSYYVTQQDQVLVLSTSVRRADIAGAETVHLIARGTGGIGVRNQGDPPPVVALWKSLIPRPLKGYARRTIRDLRVLRSRRACVQEILRFRPDVVFCNRSFPEGVLTSLCRVRPWLLRTAGPDISKRPKYPIYRQLIRNALRSANVVMTQSLWEKALLRRLCGEGLPVEVNNIGIDTTLFQPPQAKEALRERYGLPRDAFVVVSNRYLTGHYNGWSVVEAIESILGECPKLVLLYTNPLKMDAFSKKKAEAVTRRFSQVVFVDGPVGQSEVADILGCGDVYVSFSAYDGIPNSVLEAMACGLVPIAADLPQLREWIEHGVSGYIVPQNDTGGLASVVSSLYKHREMLPQVSARCIEKIQRRASYELCSARTRQLLLQTIAQVSSPTTQKNDDRPVVLSPSR
jgi:glycosyltransferase involved in cell wall biosynthesis